jgi:predicted small secreted protein
MRILRTSVGLFISARLEVVPVKQSKPKEFSMRKHIAIVLLNLVLLSGAVALLSACNTTAGVGQDVSATGRAVTDTAEKAKSGL